MTKREDYEKILQDLSSMVSSKCVCDHPAQEHYPLHWFMNGCKDEQCDCLEFEGV